MKSAAWLIGSVVVICALLGVFMMSHQGGAPAAVQADEQVEVGTLKNAASFWQAVPPPPGLSLAELPEVPPSLSANRLGPVAESYIFSRGDSWRLVGFRTRMMGVVPISWQVREDESSTALVWPVMADWANKSPEELKDAIAIQFAMSGSSGLEHLYKENLKTQQNVTAQSGQGGRVGPLHIGRNGEGFFTTSLPGRIMVTLYAPAPGRAGSGYECTGVTSAARWRTLGKTFETIVTHWYDAKGNVLYPAFKIDEAIR